MLGARKALLAATNSDVVRQALFLNNNAGSYGTPNGYAISTRTLISNSSFTIEMWINTSSTMDQIILSDPATNTNKQVFRLNYPTIGKLTIYNYPGEGGNLSSSSSSNALTGWVHLAFVCNAGANNVYLNGNSILAYSQQSTTEGRYIGFIGALFASSNYYSHFRGYISGYRLTNAVRYTSSFAPPPLFAPLPTDAADPFWSSASGVFDLNGTTLNKKNNSINDLALYGTGAFFAPAPS